MVYTEDDLIPAVLSHYPVSEGILPKGLQSRILSFLGEDWSIT